MSLLVTNTAHKPLTVIIQFVEHYRLFVEGGIFNISFYSSATEHKLITFGMVSVGVYMYKVIVTILKRLIICMTLI